MSPSPNQTHLLCWRWSSGFRGNRRAHPAPGESTAGRATWPLASPRVTGAMFAVRGLDRFRYTPPLPAWPALTQECEGSTPPLPVNSTETTKLLDSPFTAINATRTGQRCGVATDCSLSADRQPESGRRPTHRDREMLFATWWPPIRCRRGSRIGEPWHVQGRSSRGRVPLLPLSSLESRRLRSQWFLCLFGWVGQTPSQCAQCGAPCRILPPLLSASWLLSRGSVPPTKKKS